MKAEKDSYRLLVDHLPDVFARCRVICDDTGNPVDFALLEINPAFEEMTGLQKAEVVGRTLTDFFPEIVNSEFDWIGTLGRVATAGGSVRFQRYVGPAGAHCDISAYSDEQGTISVIFHPVPSEPVISASEPVDSLPAAGPGGPGNLPAAGTSPGPAAGAPALADVIDVGSFQAMMDEFFQLTGIGVAIVDIEGEVLVKTGWQEICTRFHRVNPVTAQHCLESDTQLCSRVRFGEFRLYRCKNNMWDMASPIIVSEKHLGNVFLGQFFFDDDTVDEELFRSQAQKYGFNEQEYLAALAMVPRWSRDTVNNVMRFYAALATMVSQIGYSSIHLAEALAERDDYITGLKQAEKARQQEKREKELIINNLAEQVAFLDLEYRIIWANSKVIERHALASKKYIGEKCYEIYHQLKEPCPDCPVSRVLETGTACSGIHHSPDGIYWQVAGIPVQGEGGEMIGILNTSLDVSSLVLAKQALQDSEARFQRMLKVVPDMVSVHDPDMNILYSNWSGFAAVPPEKRILKTKCYKTYRGLDRVCPDCRAVAVLESREAFEAEVELSPGNWIDLRVIPVLDDRGEVEFFMEWVRDISSIKKIEEQLRKLNLELDHKVRERTARLEASLRELDAFSYSVSHDLRGPLNRIEGFSRILLEDHTDQLDRQGQDYLRRISNSSRHMAELIEDLLKLSRVSRIEINREPVEISALANVCLKVLQAKEPHRELDAVITPGLAVEGDTALLRIALENLLGNAWKFTAQRDVARVEFGLTKQDGVSAFFIRDNGAGFDMKYADRLFDPFQRLHSEQEFPGTGIGLSIVQRIINRHGGKVWAEGKPGGGACFYFTLP